MAGKKPSARLFLDAPLAADTTFYLGRDQSHHLAQVMRVRPGEVIALFNGSDGEWRGIVSNVHRKTVTLMCENKLREQSGEPDVWLAFAPLKKTRIDFVVEKATELGVARLLPVITQYTAATRVNAERLSARVIEAAEQCERLTIPPLMPPVGLDELLDTWPADRPLFVLDETGSGRPIADAVSELCPSPGEISPPCGFLIGPEGGFSPSELDAVRNCAFVITVGVGPRILRAETAALAALASWQAIAGDWR
ncbi:MAG: 16S rRNA (uracil(1498)-N(3))-methyltransferase [Alphaproteobacteria bacterium]|nr:16S rRNA (uracil(1498)-N(3))-methyltransferase [Alphaproteobacteria bacterium]